MTYKLEIEISDEDAIYIKDLIRSGYKFNTWHDMRMAYTPKKPNGHIFGVPQIFSTTISWCLGGKVRLKEVNYE